MDFPVNRDSYRSEGSLTRTLPRSLACFASESWICLPRPRCCASMDPRSANRARLRETTSRVTPVWELSQEAVPELPLVN